MIIDKADGYIENKNGNKYLTLISTDRNKEVLIKYREIWDKIKNLIECNFIEKINGGECNFIKAGE